METQQSELLQLLRKNWIKCSMAAVIPLLLVLAIYHQYGIYPYDKVSILTSDLNGQYVSYFAYLKSMLQNGNDIFYTFSKSLGGDMIGLTGYYLFSPLNLILLFYPLQRITEAVLVITVLKIVFSGLFCYLFLSAKNKSYRYRDILFSTAYALMAYNMAFGMHLMWLDAVFLLPLILWGIERIFEQKSMLFYLIFLSMAIISCFYIGYMLCIFSVLYFVYCFFREKIDAKRRVKIVIKYACSSLLAAGLSAVILVPCLLSIQGAKSGSQEKLAYGTNFSLPDLLSKLFSGQFDNVQFAEGLPNLFCGIFILVLVLLFFLNRKISIRKKVAAAFVLAVLVASFYIRPLDIAWHGFSPPNQFTYRYSFVFSMFLIVLSNEAFGQLEASLSKPSIVVAAVMLLGAEVFVLLQNYTYSNRIFLIGDMGLTLLFLVFCYYYKHGDKDLAPVFLAGIAFLHFGNLYLNATDYLKYMDYQDMSLNGYVKELSPCLTTIRQNDDGFYRLEKNFHYSHNDPMLFSYAGLSHFSSTENSETREFLQKLGYNGNGYWTYYHQGSTIAADSLLNVKYFLKREKTDDIYENYFEENGIYAYRNPYALNIGFMVEQEVVSYQISEQENTFENQNRMYRAMTGGTQDIFVSVEDYELQTAGTTEYIENEHYFYDKVQENGSVNLNIRSPQESPLYLILLADDWHEVQIRVNGKELGEYFTVYSHSILNLGVHPKGTLVNVEIELTEDKVNFAKPQIYSLDTAVFLSYITKLQESGYYILDKSSSYFNGEVLAKKEGTLLFSIPYDKSWQASIDGKKVPVFRALDSLLAVNVTEGNHKVILKYEPQGKKAGIGISLASLGILLLYGLVLGFLQHRQRERWKKSYEI